MKWTTDVRDRARNRLSVARGGASPPPFVPDDQRDGNGVPVESRSTVDDGLPRGVRTAGAWAWRFILFVAAAYLLLRLIGLLRVVIIPVVVAMLLAALFQPVAAALRRRGIEPFAGRRAGADRPAWSWSSAAWA